MTRLIETTAKPAIINYLNSMGILGYNLLGAIEHVEGLKLYTDNVNAPTGVVGREDYFSYVVTSSMAFVDQMMATFFSEDGYYGFTGISTTIAEYLLKKNVQEHWRNDCYLFYFPDSIELPPTNHRIRSVCLKDLEEIHDHYEYQTEDSLDNIRADILKRPSSCIDIDGELASWVLVHRDDTMGIMYTKEKFRHQNLAYLLTVDLLHKVRAKGKTPYVQIISSNTASLGLAKKVGFVQAEALVTWFGIVVGDLPLED